MTWCTREFSASVWERIAGIREHIKQLPLLTQLVDGTLEPRCLVGYIIQDDFYLCGYSQALALLAAWALHTRARPFWARDAGGAVAVETLMHGALLNDSLLRSAPHTAAPSSATRGYVNFVQTAIACDPYPVGMTAILPCYWVYARVDLDLAERVGAVENHPYGTWVAAYIDPASQETTAVAIELLGKAAGAADDATRTVILDTFVDAIRYEELFWEHSHRLEA